MFYPQGNAYPLGILGAQGGFNYPQGGFNYPQGGFNYPQGSFSPQSIQGYPGNIPFANAPYGIQQQHQGYPPQIHQQQPPFFTQPTAQQQPGLQQTMPHILAHQLAAHQFAAQHPAGFNGLGGFVNGGEQINSGLLQQQPHHRLLQQLAQYHYLVAQQLAQLAAQQAVQGAASPHAGQFIPGQPAATFVPAFTMH